VSDEDINFEALSARYGEAVAQQLLEEIAKALSTTIARLESEEADSAVEPLAKRA
jgi:hypothetical protein